MKMKMNLNLNNRTQGLLALVGTLLLTAGKYVGAVFKLKGVASIVSMLVSIFAYWWTANLGLSGAILAVFLLLAHEMGHYWVARRQGIETSLPMFIPFVGAFVNLKSKPEDAEKEAWMALAGPLLGTAAAFACLPVYYWTGDKLWLWGASVGFILNLFNLLPISPLDGGRIIGAVWRGFWVIGAAALLAFALLGHEPLYLLIFVIGLGEIDDSWCKIRAEAWLFCAICFAAIAIWWGSYLVLALTALLALSYLTEMRARKHEKEKRDYNQWLLDTCEAFIAGNAKFRHPSTFEGTEEEFREVCIKARRKLIADLYPQKKQTDPYYLVSPTKKLLIGSTYVGLVALLTASMIWVSSLSAFH